MFKDKSVKIGDLNVAKVADHDGLAETHVGTPYY